MTFEGTQLQGSVKIMEKLNVCTASEIFQHNLKKENFRSRVFHFRKLIEL